MKKTIIVILICCLYRADICAMLYREPMLSQENARHILSEEDAQYYIVVSERSDFEPEELVLCKHLNGTFSFAIIKQCEAQFCYVELLDIQERVMVSKNMLFPLALFWKVMLQPTISAAYLIDLISSYLCTIPLHVKPYIKTISADCGSHYLTISDIHGDIHALQSIMSAWFNQGLIDKHLTLKDGYKVVCLGDYQDRGDFGVEVLFALLVLSLKNPGSVYLLSGNHEFPSMVSDGKLMEEWHTKFGDDAVASQAWEFVNFLFSQLPSGLLVGLVQRDAAQAEPYLMFCHGGICSVLDIRSMLLNHRKSSRHELDYDIEDMHDYALRWTDFYAPGRSEVLAGNVALSRPAIFRGTGLPELTKNFFEEYIRHFGTCRDELGCMCTRLLALVRGHQHTRGGVVVLNRYLAEEVEGLEQYLSPNDSQQAYTWSILTHGEKHHIESADVYTITSASDALWSPERRTRNYALVDASETGEWELTPFFV
jgi:hypothetical protein